MGNSPVELGGIIAIAMALVRIIERLIDGLLKKDKATTSSNGADKEAVQPPAWVIEQERSNLLKGIERTQEKVLDVTQQVLSVTQRQLHVLASVTNICVGCPHATERREVTNV